MAIRVTVNEKGVVQQESGTTAAVDINVPLSLNSTATVGGLSVLGTNRAVGSIETFGTIVPGSGYSNQASVSLGGGTGTGATASIVVSGGGVTWVQLLDPGGGYTVGDVLSIPGGSGTATVTVASVVSKDSGTGHLTAQRVGAGTVQPTAGLDSRLGAVISGAQRRSNTFNLGSYTSTFGSTPVTAWIGTFDSTEDITSFGSTATIFTRLFVISRARNTSATSGVSTNGIRSLSVPQLTTGAGALTHIGLEGQALRRDDSDLNTSTNCVGSRGVVAFLANAAAPVSFTTVSASANDTFVQIVAPGPTTTLRNYRAGISHGTTSGAHTVTDYIQFDGDPLTASGTPNITFTNYYGLRLRASNTIVGITITNNWGISQEDANSNNVYAGRSAMGQAAGTAATALVDVGASTTARSQLRLRSGTAPTSPNDGDIWFDGTNLKMQVSGVTKTFTLV